MHLTMVILGSVLLGQVPAEGDSPPAASTPPELVAEALAPRPASELAGRPLELLTALNSTADRRRQLDVTHAYWRLVETVAVYHLVLDHDRRLQRLNAPVEGATRLSAARAFSSAQLGEAEVAAVGAQHDLAALIALPADAPLPLPADLPHLGMYQTRFDEMFSARTAPARARLMDRTLPIRHRSLEGHAAAVAAAGEVLNTVEQAYALGGADLPAVLSCLGQDLQQRQALIAAVCDYNHGIADYALAVAGPGSTAQQLLGMLIGPSQDTTWPPLSQKDPQVRPAGHDEPVPTPARRPQPFVEQVPTPLPGDTAGRPPQHVENVPTPAWRPEKQPEEEPQPTLAPPRDPSPAADAQVPTLAPPQKEPAEESDAQRPTLPEPPLVPIEPKSAEPIPRTAQKPSADWSRSETPLADPTVPAMAASYSALVDVPPGVRAKQLTLALHWDRMLPERIGEPVGLADCLRDRAGGDRGALIAAYWLARQRAAEYQVLAQQAQWLDSLALEENGQPAERRLYSARLATGAALHEAHAALVEAQFDLAVRTGREEDSLWPVPSTAPHSGRYALKLDAQPRRLVGSWPMRRLAATIPGLAESVRQRAAAVVEADSARAAEGQSLASVLGCIGRQTDQTLALLQTLTDYNLAIAQYALMVLPPETSDEKLAGTLVLQP